MHFFDFSVALYHEPQGEMICLFQGQQGGVTQLAFSPDGTKLYSGGRKVYKNSDIWENMIFEQVNFHFL